MPIWAFISFSVIVAAVVGGVTNHVALQMMFHPRKAVYIGRWRIPFTPGLILKRKPDIAASLGEIVSEYLITGDGLRIMLDKPEAREQAVQAIEQIVQQWIQDETTVKEWVARLLPNETWDEVRDRFAHQLDEWMTDALKQWLMKKGWNERPIREWLPENWECSSGKWANKVSTIILTLLQKDLTSLQGQMLVKKMAKEIIDRAPGFFGAMATIFVDEDKLVSRMMPVLVEQLRSAEVHSTLAGFIATKLDEWLQKTPAQLICTLTELPQDSNSLEYTLHRTGEWFQWHRHLDDLGDKQPSRLASRYKSVWMPYVPRIANAAIALLNRNLDSVIRAARLQEVVRMQVEQFPIIKLETMIWSVSSKEFRAITWLGALFGGIIGFIHALLLLAAG